MSSSKISNPRKTAAQSAPTAGATWHSGKYTPGQVLVAVEANMTSSKKVNSEPHINTQTQDSNVNVF